MNSSQDTRGPELVAITVTFLVLTWLSVLLRFFVRIRLTKSFDVDDWLMAASLAIFTLFGAFVFAGVHFGLGRHNSSLSQDAEIQALKYQALATAIYIANMAFIKLSIAIFLLRIAVYRRYHWILKISMVIVAIWTAGIFLFDVFQCNPVALQWDFTLSGTCVSSDSLVAAAYALSVLSVLSDWLYALLPIPMLWNVKMNLNTKVAVVVILSLGIFASSATLIRIKYLIDLENTDDILYASTDTLVWTIVEPGLGIIAASVVTLRPLLRALHIRGFTSDSGGPYTNSGDAIGNGNGNGGLHARSHRRDTDLDLDTEALGANAQEPSTHDLKMTSLRASSVAGTSVSGGTSKKGPSANVTRTYEGDSDNESQEVILAQARDDRS